MKIKNFSLIISFLIIVALGLTTYKIAATRSQSSRKNGLKIVASFYPNYFFSKEIVGTKGEVVNITPPGAEPHDFEPNALDLAKIEGGDLLVLNGAGLEPWGARVENGKTKIIKLTENLVTKQLIEDGKKIQDPHVWLDPVLAKSEVETITKTLIDIDSINKTFYTENSKVVVDKLISLDSEYKKALANCSLKDIITSHAAFGYIASRYGFNQISISGLTPDEEPSPAKLSEIANLAKQKGIKYIFFESLVEPRLSETLAKEIGAQTLVFNPLEGLTKDQEKSGKDYFSIQRENLENLKIALNCK